MTRLVDLSVGEATKLTGSAAWKVVMPILEAWKKYPSKQLHSYKSGTWGPVAADALLKPYAKEWFRLPERNVHA